VTLSADETVADAIKKMSDGGYRHLPIVDGGGQPAGLASVAGIVHYLVDHFPNTIYNLPPDPNATQREREGA
jgi:CBS domain-containing protein